MEAASPDATACKTRIALDSCAIIPILGKSDPIISKIQTVFDPDSTVVVLYDAVLDEVLPGTDPECVENEILESCGYKTEFQNSTGSEKELAAMLSKEYGITHRGDDLILAMSKLRALS